jgi:hypothetical protein
MVNICFINIICLSFFYQLNLLTYEKRLKFKTKQHLLDFQLLKNKCYE